MSKPASEQLLLRSAVDADLCVGCGICAALCPQHAIQMVLGQNGCYVPLMDKDRCTLCTLCEKVCPGVHGDVPRDVEEPPARDIHFHEGFGGYRSCFVGHTTDEEIRQRSASGGIVSAVLIYCIEHGVIDGAVVVGTDEGEPMLTKAFVARSREEVLVGAKSKYAPVNLAPALREVVDIPGRYALVGLPCHVLALRRAQAVNNALKDRIVLTISLLCGHGTSYHFTEYLLARQGIEPRTVCAIDYREKATDGHYFALRTTTRNPRTGERNEFRLPFPNTAYGLAWTNLFFSLRRCTLCGDFAGEWSDLSCGDAWLPEYREEPEGRSVLISRSALSESLIDQMQKGNLIKIEAISPERVAACQAIAIRFKKDGLKARLRLMCFLGEATPSYSCLKHGASSPAALLSAVRLYALRAVVEGLHRVGCLRLVNPFLLVALFRPVAVTKVIAKRLLRTW